jgi:hypothetical protein
MNGPRSIPPPRENKKPDEEIQQGRNSQITFNRGGIFLRRGNQRHFERLAVAADSVADFSPGARAKEQLGDVRRAVNPGSTEGLDVISLLDSGPIAGRAGSDVPSPDAVRRIHPGDAVIGNDKARALLEVHNGEHHRRQRQNRQGDCPQP